MPLLLLTGPGTTTLVTTSVSLTLTASSCTLPSSIRIMSPGRTSAGRPLKVVLQRCTSPRMLSMVMVKVWPSTNSTGPAANRPSRILGPWRSASRPTVLPMAFAAARVSARRRACSSWEPWLMLKRATSRPARISSSIRSWVSVAGPRVQTIFALRTGQTLSGMATGHADNDVIRSARTVSCPAVRHVADGELKPVDAGPFGRSVGLSR